MSLMERLVNEIRPGTTDDEINKCLASRTVSRGEAYSKHFNQNEEFFLRLSSPYDVPSFLIHHDIRVSKPEAEYLATLRVWFKSFIEIAPPFFSDLNYFFDPGEVLKPCLFKLYRLEEKYFLFLLRIDLSFRPLESVCLVRGTNDRTAAFRTDRLYLECDFIPLESVDMDNGKVSSFIIKQTISQTWIGETGKGYMVRGIWMDSELGKYFSKLFLPSGKRCYPFYPYTCKYKTVCMTVVDPDSEWRRRYLPYLHLALEHLVPVMPAIQEELKAEPFSENLPLFHRLKGEVPDRYCQIWQTLNLKPYLNANDQKEYIVEL